MNSAKDLTGQKFGRLTAIKRVGSRNGYALWECKCDCGNTKITTSTKLVQGVTTSCGCYAKYVAKYVRHNYIDDLTGQKFNRLTVLGQAGRGSSGQVLWDCLCECGKHVVVRGNNLKSGKVKSCGCYKNDIFVQHNMKHGMSDTKLHSVWSSMKSRCTCPTTTGYKWYGGRGIKVCAEWQTFELFCAWAMSHGYKEGLTIDRIDVNGDYCPENCRWITMQEQLYNTTRNHRITVNGVTKTVTEWANERGMKYNTILTRLDRGWSEYDAVMTPAGCRRSTAY